MKLQKTRTVMLILLIPMVFGSCVVSKKKYEELSYAKRRSDAKVGLLTKENKNKDGEINDLNGRLDKTLAEFNEMKNSMAESNAMKTSEIDALSGELMGLSSDTTELRVRLTQTLEQFQRAKENNVEHLSLISQLRQRIKVLVSDSTSMAQEVRKVKVNADWSKRKIAKDKLRFSDLLKAKEAELSALSKELEDYKGKASWLRKVNLKNKEEIERLTNQLNLYKRELNKALKK